MLMAAEGSLKVRSITSGRTNSDILETSVLDPYGNKGRSGKDIELEDAIGSGLNSRETQRERVCREKKYSSNAIKRKRKFGSEGFLDDLF